ncbi:MAG: Ig-like domain-containing protein [Candidatus Omnitrophota bacterium]
MIIIKFQRFNFPVFLAGTIFIFNICFAEPARVIKVVPSAGSRDVLINTKILIYFNQAMDQDSVERNIHIYPETAVDPFWEEHTLVLVPKKRLVPSEQYTISLSPAIKDKKGNPLSLTYFTTVEHILYANTKDVISSVSRDGREKYELGEGESASWHNTNRKIIYANRNNIWMMDFTGEDKQVLTDETENINMLPQWKRGSDEYIYM